MAKLHHAVKLKQIGVRWVPGGGMSGAGPSAGPIIEDAAGNVSRMTRQRALQEATQGGRVGYHASDRGGLGWLVG